jgi:hypothetical protein
VSEVICCSIWLIEPVPALAIDPASRWYAEAMSRISWPARGGASAASRL